MVLRPVIDNFKAIYKILSALEKAMDLPEFNVSQIGADALDALKNPVKIGEMQEFDSGDIRQSFFGENAIVTISIRDNRLIQTNPWKGK